MYGSLGVVTKNCGLRLNSGLQGCSVIIVLRSGVCCVVGDSIESVGVRCSGLAGLGCSNHWTFELSDVTWGLDH